MFTFRILFGGIGFLLSVLFQKATAQSSAQKSAAEKISFSYSLATSARTSAGVFKADGTLVRTLWSNEEKPAGTHITIWDGLDDNQQLTPTGNYNVKVLSNNVSYTWLNPVGNTSVQSSGSTVHHAAQIITNMVAVGDAMYYAVGYNEGGHVHEKFQLGSPNMVATTFKGAGATVRFLTSDGGKVYFAGQTGNAFFVSAINAVPNGLDTLASFTGGTPLPVHGFTYSAFDVTPYTNYLDPSQHLTGLSVQPAGNYLFVSHGGTNVVKVYNKNTGAFVRSISIANPRDSRCDAGGNLWLITGANAVIKYEVNADGSLGAALLTLSGLSDPLALALSPDGAKMAVADRGAYHQVKLFSTANGALVQTIGRTESYANPAVYDDKFYFNNTRIFSENDWGYAHVFVAYQPDGSLWVGDYGNMRCQHFTANGTYIDNIQYMGYSYSAQADVNNPTRVFSDFLEFAVDYTNDTWRYVRNWSRNITIPAVYDADRMRSVATLSNGRTYALYKDPLHGRELIELDMQQGIRHTGLFFSNTVDLNPDGSLWQIGDNAVGAATWWKRRPLLSFDASNNLAWGAYQTLETTPPVEAADPLTVDGYLNRCAATTTGVVATYCSNSGNGGRGSGWHLGGIKGGKWMFKTAASTNPQYGGSFPKDAYEIGNGTNYTGTFMQTVDRNIFFGQQCEFWKGGQVNKHKHYWDNGLQIGEFGATVQEAREAGIPAYPGMAGNANSGTYVKVGNDIHLLHCDESYHAGVHHWKISGLESISEQVIPVSINLPQNGLRAYHYSSNDLNNLNTISTGAVTSLSVNGSSARWEGHLVPATGGRYNLFIQTANACRVWLGGRLVIDAWNNSGSTELASDTALLDAGVYYPLRIEARASATLLWASANTAKQAVPVGNLYAAKAVDTSTGYNLMEGLPYGAFVGDGLYGYTRTPSAEIKNNRYNGTGWWSVLTNVQTYRKEEADAQAELAPAPGMTSASLNRDLGANENLRSWRLTGLLTYPSEDSEAGASDKSYLELLDKNGKVILRVERREIAYPNDYRMYANDRLVFAGTREEFKDICTVPHAFEVALDSNGLSFTYANHTAANLPLIDAAGLRRCPKTFRLSFSSTTNGHTTDVANMRFHKMTSPVPLPVNFTGIKVYRKVPGAQVEWWMAIEDDVKKYEVERSTDGSRFSQIGSVPAAGVLTGYGFFDTHPVSGINYYRIRSVEVGGATKYSKVASVRFEKEKSAFNVFPNPVTGHSFVLQFNNVPKASYTINLVNATGQTVFTQGLWHEGGFSSRKITTLTKLPAGTYSLHVSGGGITASRHVIIASEK